MNRGKRREIVLEFRRYYFGDVEGDVRFQSMILLPRCFDFPSENFQLGIDCDFTPPRSALELISRAA